MILQGTMILSKAADDSLSSFHIFQEDFCDHVEEQFNRVYRQRDAVSDDNSLTAKKKIADVVQQLKETTFFL